MMYKSSLGARVAILAFAAFALWQIAGPAFIAPTPARTQYASMATMAAAAAAMPQPAQALISEQPLDGWGPSELLAIAIPFVFVATLYIQWETQQEPTDDVVGVGVLKPPNDGPKAWYD